MLLDVLGVLLALGDARWLLQGCGAGVVLCCELLRSRFILQKVSSRRLLLSSHEPFYTG